MPLDFAYSSTSLRELKKCFKSFLWTCKEPWVFVAYVCAALGMCIRLWSPILIMCIVYICYVV